MALQTPSPTLYISNLETKTKKPELRSGLYALFNPFGSILDIVAKKNDGGRGQAFVVFADQAAATSAMRNLTGELFYGKALNITYAKTKSNATLAREDPTRSKEAEALKAAKLVVSRAQGEYEALEKEREEQEAGLGKRALDGEGGEDGEGGPATKKVKRESAAAEEEEEEMEIEMEDDEDALPQSNGSAPGTTIICSNLPPEATEQILAALYGQYPGFSTASPHSAPLPSSHPTPNAGARSFRVVFASPAQAKEAAEKTRGYDMQPGWNMGVSVE